MTELVLGATMLIVGGTSLEALVTVSAFDSTMLLSSTKQTIQLKDRSNVEPCSKTRAPQIGG